MSEHTEGRNIYITFLGTSNYWECNYSYKNKTVNNVRFIQSALAQIFCEEWSERDVIYVLVTKESRIKNWDSLSKSLKDIGLRCQIKPVDIFEGKNEGELWKNFSIILEKLLKEKDRVIVDITHSFRTIPMWSFIALTVAEKIKNIEICGIYYGACDEKNKDKIAPIFDLLPFKRLVDWNSAIYEFLTYGNADNIDAFINTEMRNEEFRNNDGAKLKQLASMTSSFCKKVWTCRLESLMKEDYNKFIEQIELAKKSRAISLFSCMYDPLTRLFKPLSELSSSCDSQEQDILKALIIIEYCKNKGLIQQAYTMLRETILLYLKIKYRYMLQEIDTELISKILHIISSKKGEEQWDTRLKKDKKTTEELVDLFKNDLDPEFFSNYDKLISYRNNINHAGIGKNKIRETKILNEFKSLFNYFNEHIRSNINR